MNKHIRRAAFLVCLCILLACTACVRDRDESIPEGMKLATAAGADFRLYIPSAWNVNTAYGVSGGYYNFSKQSTVSMEKYTFSETVMAELAVAYPETENPIDRFWQAQCLSAVEALALAGSRTEVEAPSASLLADKNARRYVNRANVKGQIINFMHVVAAGDANSFYVFSYAANEELYDALMPEVEKILDQIIFTEPYTPEPAKAVADEEIPAGMQAASNTDVAYRFFVPESWTVNTDIRIFSAYVPADRANVSVVPYSPEVNSMSVGEYFDLVQDRLKAYTPEGGFELLNTQTEVDLGGRAATAYTYLYTVGGVQYKYLQVIAAYKSMIYSLTYTALPESFDTHLADVWAMVDVFEFR